MFLQVDVHDQAEDHSQDAKHGPAHQQAVAVHSKKLDLSQIRQLQIGFASNLVQQAVRKLRLPPAG